MLRMGRKRGLLLVWLAVLLLLAVPLYGQSILTQAVSGTGFIVSSDGYIITNRHVINGATKISVTIGNKEYEARVVDSLSDNDIALLKVDAHGLPAVMLGDSDYVQIGDTVYAIGCPAGVCGTITQGRVANLGISSKTDEGTTLHNLIMSDLTTTHGSSGGPLLNDKGEVIGITTAGIVVQGETTGFGVSIPINQAIALLREVPGFSTSQMGRATTVLTLDEVRRSVGPDTAFVQAEVQKALTDFLPREALGIKLDVTDDSTALVFPGVPVLPGLLALPPRADASGSAKYGQVDRYVRITVIHNKDSKEALQNRQEALNHSIQLGYGLFDSLTIIRSSKVLGETPIDLLVIAGDFPPFINLDTSIELQGGAVFALGDLLFEISLSDADKRGIRLDDKWTYCACCSWSSWQIDSGQLIFIYECKDPITGQVSTYTHRSGLNVDSFVHDFQTLINTVISAALDAAGRE